MDRVLWAKTQMFVPSFVIVFHIIVEDIKYFLPHILG